MARRFEKAIVFLTKQPIPGKVKTRLAQSIGAEEAAAVHEILVYHCLAVASSCTAPIIVALDGDLEGAFADNLRQKGALVIAQERGDLGKKIYAAFSVAQRVIVLGTDTPNIEAEELQRALQEDGITIGPSVDGGYWLIGGSEMPRSLFENIPWSTDQVLQKTAIQLQYKSLTCQYLSTLADIDYQSDLLSFLSHPSPYPHLQEQLKYYARNKRIP